VFLLLAEAASLTGVISPALLPPVLSVLGRTAGLVGNATFLGDLAATVAAWAVGLVITVAVPVLLNTIDGARSIDQVQMETARAYRLPWHQRVTRLILPAAAPKIFAGLRLSLSLALVLMVIAELVGTANGIGYEMDNAANTFDLPGLWSGIVLLGILGFALNAALLAVAHRVLAWSRDARRMAA
jgi:ABC-type nitrate/sulfonate/bicarbonate transport system permease component